MKKLIGLFILIGSIVRADVLSTLLPEYKAYDAYLQSQYDVARDEYSNLLEADPYDAQGNYNVGTVLYKKGEAQEAEQYFKRSVEHVQDNIGLKEQALFNLGNSYMQLKKYQAAIDSYEKVLQLNEHSDKALKNLEIAKRLLESEQQKETEQKQQGDQNQQQDQQDSQDQEQKQDGQKGSEQKQDNQKDDKSSDQGDKDHEQKQNMSEQSQQQGDKDNQGKQQNDAEQKNNETKKQEEEQKKSLDQERQDKQEETAKQNSEQRGENQHDQSLKQGEKRKEQREEAEKQMKDADKGLEKKEGEEKNIEPKNPEQKAQEEKLQDQSLQSAKSDEQKKKEAALLSNQYAEQMDADVAHDDRLDKKDIRLLKLLSEQEDSIHKQLLKMNVSKQGTEKHGQKNW